MAMSHLEELKKITDGFSKKSVLVVGDLMLDRYLWGNVSRISPEAPVPVVEISGETTRLGGAANVARNVVSLGGRARVVGVVGDDAQGRELLAELEGCTVLSQHVLVDSARPTTIKTRIIAHNQQVVRADLETRASLDESMEEKVVLAVDEGLRGSNAVIVSDYGKGVLTERVLNHVITQSRKAGLPICVDPKETKLLSYVGVTVITPNQHEAGFAYGKRIVDDNTLLDVGWGLSKRLGSEAVLITRGELGMSLFERDGTLTHFPTVAREVFDVTGAGDTVVSAFALSVAAGASLKQAASVSNHAAGIVIRELGTATASVEEILESFQTDGQWAGW